MKIGLYPFASCENIQHNLEIMDKAVSMAAASSVRLLVFHECALCGYPPIESRMKDILPIDIDSAVEHLRETAKANALYVAVGTVRFDGDKRYNSMLILDDRGNVVGWYDKQALWGWDLDHFSHGTLPGVFEIDSVKIGFRICFDIRFPELFRQLYRQETDLCIVCFSDTQEKPDTERYDIITSHLITRAVENTMTVASVNSIARFQTAPTAVINASGQILLEANSNKEQLVCFDYERAKIEFGTSGIRNNIAHFSGNEG